MRGLTEAQLAGAAKKFIHPDEVIWIVVGDLAKVEKGIRELGYGEIVRLNADGEVIPYVPGSDFAAHRQRASLAKSRIISRIGKFRSRSRMATVKTVKKTKIGSIK
jgi:hypothetical protein